MRQSKRKRTVRERRKESLCALFVCAIIGLGLGVLRNVSNPEEERGRRR